MTDQAETTTDRHGRLVMACCEAPADKITATGAYYSRHNRKGLMPACQQAMDCRHAYEQELRGRPVRW